MKARVAAVALDAAKMRSPSFSRFSLSTTTTGLPSRMSAIARSMRVEPDVTHTATASFCCHRLRQFTNPVRTRTKNTA